MKIEKEKNRDNRMDWILVSEECEKNPDKKAYFTEYEICSEARIPGVLDYNDGNIICGLMQEKNEQGLYTYLIRVKHIEKVYEFDKNKYSTEGYYFKDGLIGELLAIFSFYFQARFYLSATLTGILSSKSLRMRFENKFQYKKPDPAINYEMFTHQERNWSKAEGLKSFLDKVRNLDQKYHQSLIRAFYWYNSAIKEIGVDHQLFYIKMTSSIEALLKFIMIKNDGLEGKLKNLITKKNFTEDESQAINNWLKNRKIGQRFTIFIKTYSDGFWKDGVKEANHCYISKKELNTYTKRIYNARSSYLHEGKPMYISGDIISDFAKEWDLDGNAGMMVDRKIFSEKEKLPRTRWFERITNYCIKNFIKNLK